MARERTAGYFIFNAVFASFLALFIVFAVRFANCFGAAERLPGVERYEIMRILPYGTSAGSDGETVSASVSILDTSGNECARIERSWRGSVLAVDFKSAEFSGKRFYFPCELYGREIVSAASPFSVVAARSFFAITTKIRSVCFWALLRRSKTGAICIRLPVSPSLRFQPLPRTFRAVIRRISRSAGRASITAS